MVVVVIVVMIVPQNKPYYYWYLITILTHHFIILTQKQKYAADIISGTMLACSLSEAGIPLPGGLMNKTILEIIISQQKFAIFTLEAFRKIKTVGLIDIFWQVNLVKTIKEILI